MESKLLTAKRFVDPKTGCSYRYVYSNTEYFRPHYHDYFEIFLMLEGRVLHQINGAEIHLKSGDLVFIRPSDEHNYLCKSTCSWLNLTFTAETAQELFDYLGQGFPAKQLLHAKLPPQIHLTDRQLQQICKQMDGIRAIHPDDHQQTRTALRILLFYLFTRHFGDIDLPEDNLPPWLEAMCAQMRKNFALGSEYFFSLSGKSREHISRTLKKYTGMTVTEYINSLRLNYIANMLTGSNHSISHIIFESGFNNISWASAQFKEKYGMTMSEYRAGAKKQ